jgi:hypothetical protein
MSARTVVAALGWLATAAFLVAGAPPLVRMPLWGDTTLYDVAARNVLAGGIHYRDVFDTNPPGFVWMLCGIRAAFGPSAEAIRAVDLGIAVAVVGLLLVWARRAGASHAAVAWAAAASAAFYPFLDEFNHAQRDLWMMLPAIVAVGLRMRRLERPDPRFAGAFLEGLVWGCGCWIKPHVVFVAAAVWLATAGRFGSRRRALSDLAAVVAGGLVAGLAGLGWLVGTGTWPHFLDVWRNWNAAYAGLVFRELPFRVTFQLQYFPAYSVFAVLAVPLALWNLRDRAHADPVRFRRAVLAALYLAWLLTTLLLQRVYHYTHVPETFLMLAVFAANRWSVPMAAVLLQVAAGVLPLVAEYRPNQSTWVYRHLTARNPAFDPDRARWWAECLAREPSREARRGVGLFEYDSGGLDPVELGAVADFLREQDVRDGELIAWHDSPHALYLELGIRPSFRFMHVGTANDFAPHQRARILEELRAALPWARFAVSDMCRITKHRDRLAEGPPTELPAVLPAWQRAEFPFDQPVVFRSPSGRFRVHAITNPVRSCEIPFVRDQSSPERAVGSKQ